MKLVQPFTFLSLLSFITLRSFTSQASELILGRDCIHCKAYHDAAVSTLCFCSFKNHPGLFPSAFVGMSIRHSGGMVPSQRHSTSTSGAQRRRSVGSWIGQVSSPIAPDITAGACRKLHPAALLDWTLPTPATGTEMRAKMQCILKIALNGPFVLLQ